MPTREDCIPRFANLLIVSKRLGFICVNSILALAVGQFVLAVQVLPGWWRYSRGRIAKGTSMAYCASEAFLCETGRYLSKCQGGALWK
jgi:hypothetical protein